MPHCSKNTTHVSLRKTVIILLIAFEFLIRKLRQAPTEKKFAHLFRRKNEYLCLHLN